MAETAPAAQSKPRSLVNLKTQRAHRRQTFWQIYFPLLLAVLLLGGLLALLLGSGNGGSVEQAAQVSVIMLALPVLAIGLVLGALFVLLAFGVGRAIHWLPLQTAKAQRVARNANQAVQRGAKALVRLASTFDNIETSIDKLMGRDPNE